MRNIQEHMSLVLAMMSIALCIAGGACQKHDEQTKHSSQDDTSTAMLADEDNAAVWLLDFLADVNSVDCAYADVEQMISVVKSHADYVSVVCAAATRVSESDAEALGVTLTILSKSDPRHEYFKAQHELYISMDVISDRQFIMWCTNYPLSYICAQLFSILNDPARSPKVRAEAASCIASKWERDSDIGDLLNQLTTVIHEVGSTEDDPNLVITVLYLGIRTGVLTCREAEQQQERLLSKHGGRIDNSGWTYFSNKIEEICG